MSFSRYRFHPSVLLLAVTLAAAACSSSSSPAAPSRPSFVANTSGSWAGVTSIGTCVGDTVTGGVAGEVCLSVGASPIIARFEQTGDVVAGEVTYQGVPSSVAGTINGRTVRLGGASDVSATRFEIRDWRTEFKEADQMSGTFTLVLTSTRDGGIPATASMTILVDRLVRR